MEVAETSSGDNNKRVEDARRARVAWLQKLRRECATEEEFQTARTQPTWTELDVTSSSSCLQDGSSPADLERMREENRLHFQHLLSEDRYPHLVGSERIFLSEFNGFYVDCKGRLEAGQKIGGGGQADIHEAILDGQVKAEWVLKVFRSDCSLADLQRSWVKDIAKIADLFMPIRGLDRPYFNCCAVIHGTLLESERFAFVLERCWGDLRKAIDSQIVKDKTHVGPPFPIITSCELLRSLARGMRQLHREHILHRDLKAGNCLLRRTPVEGAELWLKNCLIADFDSPKGVVGTGFWRAPEVLLALKNKGRDLHSNQEIWTTKVDVYSFAMTCYEVLTGCIPFEDRAPNDYDGVIGGERPPLPDYVNPRLQELIKMCWHSEPSMRPEFQHIVRELLRLRRDEEAHSFVSIE